MTMSNYFSNAPLGLDGMAKIFEPLTNVVTNDRSKALTDLNQNGKQPSIGAASSPIADVALPAKEWSLTHSGAQVERGKPVLLPLGRQTARRADGSAGMGRWKKRRPSCNGADRG